MWLTMIFFGHQEAPSNPTGIDMFQFLHDLPGTGGSNSHSTKHSKLQTQFRIGTMNAMCHWMCEGREL